MSSQSLEELLQRVGNPVDLVRNSQIGPYVYPSVPSEFSNWRDEQHAWRETCCLFDQSYHMTDMYIKGPDAIRLLSDTGVNSFATFEVDKAKQFVACNANGYVIGDAILFYLDKDLLNLVGRPSAHNWVQYHCETGGYNASVERDERAAVNPNNRRVYRYQVQGPTALKLLEKINGGPLPAIKFFNMGEITIAGRKVRALHHGMSGVPGLELFGPWEEGAEIKAAIVAAGEEFGLRQVGSRVYATNTLESGWIPCPLPAIFTGDDMKAYREWLPASRVRGHRLARGQLLHGQHRGLLPDAVRPRLWHAREVRPRLHRARCRRAALARPEAQEGDARLGRRRRRRGDRDHVPQRETRPSTSISRCPTTRRGPTTGSCWTARWSGCRRSPATARTRARCCRSPSSTSSTPSRAPR